MASPCGGSHYHGGRQRLGQRHQIAGRIGHAPLDDEQVENGDHRKAAQSAHRRAKDHDFGITHQGVVDQNLSDAADNNRNDGQIHYAVGLEDRGAHQLEADKNGGNPQDGQDGTGDGRIHIAQGDEFHNGAAQSQQTEAAGQGNEGGHPHGGLGNPLGSQPVAPGQAGGDAGDDAGRQGDHQVKGQVVDAHGLTVGAVEAAGRVQDRVQLGGRVCQQGLLPGIRIVLKDLHSLGKDIQKTVADAGHTALNGGKHILELIVHQVGVDDSHQRHGAGTEGDGNGQLEQPGQYHPAPVGLVGGPGGAAPAGTEVVEGQIDHRQHAAEGDADEGAGGRQPVADVLRPEGQAHDHHGKAQTQEKLAQRLNDLGDRGGHHVHVPLGIAPEGGAAAGAQHRRRQRPHAEHGFLIANDIGCYQLSEH